MRCNRPTSYGVLAPLALLPSLAVELDRWTASPHLVFILMRLVAHLSLFGTLLLPAIALGQSRQNVGRCYTNATSGAFVGRIADVAKHPASGQLSYKVEDGRGGFFYLSPERGIVRKCDEATSRQASVDTLVGMCVFNKSDGRFLGRAIRATMPNASGEQTLTVALEKTFRVALGQASMDVTYPRNASARKCSRGID
jgi:hypothetical protein